MPKGVSSESAWLAWLILFLSVNAYWIGYDLWAKQTGHYTMTHQMKDWLQGSVSGPLIFGLLTFIVAAFFFHMLVKAST